ncbi:MAG: DNA adenine methylase [Dehalococcoidia bacterium]
MLPRRDAVESAADTATAIVKWAGGKRSLRDQLLALAPRRFATYYEPFLGGATYFLSLASRVAMRRAVLADANAELMQLYEAVRDMPDAVMAELDVLQPHAADEQFFYRLRATPPDSLAPAARAARFIYLNKTCYNGLYRVNRKGQFNVPFGRYPTRPSLYSPENLRRVALLLRRADLRCGDFGETLAGAGPGDFIYLDPPYAPLTPTASFTRYTRGAFGEDDQRRLAATMHDLTARGCKALLSNSETPLIRELYGGGPYRIDVVYAPRNINSDPTRRHKIAELAIRNYDLDEA